MPLVSFYIPLNQRFSGIFKGQKNFNEAKSCPPNIYLFKVNNRKIRKMCETCSKLIIKTPERRQRRRSGVFIVTFELISNLFQGFCRGLRKKFPSFPESSLISYQTLPEFTVISSSETPSKPY